VKKRGGAKGGGGGNAVVHPRNKGEVKGGGEFLEVSWEKSPFPQKRSRRCPISIHVFPKIPARNPSLVYHKSR